MPKIKKKAYKLRHSYLQAIGIVLILFLVGLFDYLTSNSAVRGSLSRDEPPTITLNVPGSTTRFISRL